MSGARVKAHCKKCREKVDFPDAPFARALIAAFNRVHAGHDDKKGKR